MEELKTYVETAIALTTKHIDEDEKRKTDWINGRFFDGRLAVEKNDLEIFKKISDMLNKI